ncbi:myosin-like coiled-coil protein (macronuclear) [Tetrahymena thermophila SB210]|uniref:Myosin-like coiled-coil protein n=1 Tax=Tetrahymena thermophila (strain SB210) TaxID=312017 RepID=A4VE14_TETTS|nr:myosin-like coiled-coil protein [Tetrahymena thermophila SB210]EDK31771.2 myosin-like coiled-coil protein [Tetrahymena thermophila SB210]|eukprot:XP_001471325.2 myosin-like coiled-coil protein [Tetrahymena thermophila SB210]
MDSAQEQNTLTQLQEAIQSLKCEEIDFSNKLPEKQFEDEFKKLKKKYEKAYTDLKEFISANPDDANKIQEKFEKILKDIKQAAKDYAINKKLYETLIANFKKTKDENAQCIKSKDNYEKLHKALTAQYQEQINTNKELQEKEKQKRTELAEQFQQRIKDIQSSVEEKSRDRIQKEKENEILKEKLKEITAQQQTTELIFSTQIKKKELEMQLQEAKLGQEFELIKQQAQLVSKFQEEIDKQKELDVKLEERLNVYLEQDKKFQDIMVESNSKFTNYKQAHDSLIDSQKKTESSINELKKKNEKTDFTLLDMVEKNVKLKEDLKKQLDQLSGLENLYAILEKQLADKTAAKQ